MFSHADVFTAAIILILVWALLVAAFSRDTKKVNFAQEVIKLILGFLGGILTGKAGMLP